MPALRVAVSISDTVAGPPPSESWGACANGTVLAGAGLRTAMVDGVHHVHVGRWGRFQHGANRPRNGNDHMVVAPVLLFNASDGPIAIAPDGNNWQQLCTAPGLKKWMSNCASDSAQRREDREAINATVESVIGAAVGQSGSAPRTGSAYPRAGRTIWRRHFRSAGAPSGDGHRIGAASGPVEIRVPGQNVVTTAGPNGREPSPRSASTVGVCRSSDL